MNKSIRVCLEWFWYNNMTRIVLLLGGHMVILLPIMLLFGADASTIKVVALVTWLALYVWMVSDNQVGTTDTDSESKTIRVDNPPTEKCNLTNIINSTRK